MPDVRVYSTRYSRTGFSGCCSASILSGLGAAYTTPHTATRWRQYLLDYFRRTNGRRTTNLVKPNKPFTPAANQPKGWGQTFYQWANRANQHDAMPLHFHFTALMDIMRKLGGGGSLIFIADNVANRGSRHAGVYSCRGFARWLQKNKLADVATAKKPVKGSHGDNVSGWVVTFKGNKALTARQDAQMIKVGKQLVAHKKAMDKIFPDGYRRAATKDRGLYTRW